jgi:hypothetical protein
MPRVSSKAPVQAPVKRPRAKYSSSDDDDDNDFDCGDEPYRIVLSCEEDDDD